MHRKIFEAFEAICRPLGVTGRVLEIGASPHHQTLLDLPALRGAAERIGVGLDGPAAGAGHRILHADAHDIALFADGAFDLVLCNSMLEHDPHFWLTLAEARRVAAPGGFLMFGVPGYAAMGTVPGQSTIAGLARIPLLGRRWRAAREALAASSATLGVHDFPGDYYRFSEQAMAEVLLEGLADVQTRIVLAPPRVLGWGRKP
jgi:SAM-dependent methyltransferase